MDAKPGSLRKVRADMIKMVEAGVGESWPMKEITFQNGVEMLRTGRILHIKLCIENGGMTGILFLVELKRFRFPDFVLLKLAPDVGATNRGFYHMRFQCVVL